MIGVSGAAQPVLKNVLLLADASGFSETGIPFAIAVARRYESKVHVLQVVTPLSRTSSAPFEDFGGANHAVQGEVAGEMRRLDSRLNGVAHEILTINEKSFWSGTQKVLESRPIDLLILSSDRPGQTMETLSISAKVTQKAGIPVLTIGPAVSSRREVNLFHRVLFATDLSPESTSAVRRAVTIVQDIESELFFLHIMRDPSSGEHIGQDSVANVMHLLYELVPCGTNVLSRPKTLVRYGNSAQQILGVAREHDVGLIVLGVREARDLESATHDRDTAHNVLIRSCCPILTVPVEEGRLQASPRYVS